MQQTERWDLYNRDMILVRSMLRGQPIPPGLYHPTVEVIPTDGHGHFLVTQRAPGKREALTYEFTAGSVLSRETNAQAAIRELHEETGIPGSAVAKLHLLARFFVEGNRGRYHTGGMVRFMYLAVIPDLLELNFNFECTEVYSYEIITYDQWENIYLNLFAVSKQVFYKNPEVLKRIRMLCGYQEKEEPAQQTLKLVTTTTLPTRRHSKEASQ